MARSTSLMPRPRPGFALVVAVLVVAAIAATTVIARLGFPWAAASGSALNAPVRVQTLVSAHLACPVDPYFSPDGAHIALLGALNECPAEGSDQSAPVQRITWELAIFSSATGALERVIPLDPLLGDHGRASLITRYASLGWSPDGTRLAVVYTTFSGRGDAQPGNVLDSGLLLVSARNGEASVIRGPSGFFSALSGVSSGYPIWNTAERSALSGYVPEPGLAYSWGPEGVPAAAQPLHGNLSELPHIVGASYPVGDPSGGSRFTIWQPGLVIGERSAGGGLGQSLFVSLIPTWSEDGTWLTVILAEVALTGPDQTDPRGVTGVAPVAPYPIAPNVSAVPSRGAALDAVRRQVGASGWAIVAWNPSGKQLASVACFASPKPALELRDARTGTTQAAVSLDAPGGASGCRTFGDADTFGAYPHPPLMLRWSPDGARLLLSDRDAATFMIWKAQQG